MLLVLLLLLQLLRVHVSAPPYRVFMSHIMLIEITGDQITNGYSALLPNLTNSINNSNSSWGFGVLGFWGFGG